ncbi:MAG: helix-turn-helix transcriptional regulator [Treponemataceae bacterium]|nr:helix-turn-helix transcriptional regulator [Treponemataceae bacterium]
MATLMGEKLKDLLLKRGISQKELAQIAGVTEAAVSHYISGDRAPRGAILLKIANALGTTTDFLLSISEKEDNSISSENEIENSFRLLARNANKISLEQKEKFLKLLLQVQGG